jgi:hypothetical protein
MCTYCKALNHTKKDCPQLVAKWQARGNPNQTLNQNVQMISAKRHSEGPKITVIMHGGARTGTDMETRGNQMEKFVAEHRWACP